MIPPWLIARRSTGELRPWARRLLHLRRRLRARWYQRLLPRLIRARVLARHWCRHAPLGRLLCAPLPDAVTLAAQYLALCAALVPLFGAWALWSRLHCAAAPCGWSCARCLLARQILSAADWQALCPGLIAPALAPPLPPPQ